MRKYFYTFILTTLVIIVSIAYLGNVSKDQLSNFAIKLTSNLNEASNELYAISSNKYDFTERYPSIYTCNLNYSVLTRDQINFNPNSIDKYDYSTPAPDDMLDARVTRAVLVYFPIEMVNDFIFEFKWLYRSWIEMQKSEPAKWRTDLVVFINNDELFKDKSFFLNGLNCTFQNRRTSPTDEPMCSLIYYKPLKNRPLKKVKLNMNNKTQVYDYLLNKLDVFSDDATNLSPFYNILKLKISSYGYLDSILMAFDGYNYLKSAGYNFVIRSDMDVFLTPLFAKWLPKNCNDFYVGRGGYSSNFNVNRLRRIANDLGFKFALETNLGSTWYSTVDQFRLVSYLTLFGMAYVSEEEFTPPEREGKLGVLLWPYWHYGVLLLYGQNLALNHLIATNQINVVKLHDHLDYPSYFSNNINTMLHIHVFHGDDMFSKFQFKAGKYDNLNPYNENTNIAKFYSLKMALEGKRLNETSLNGLFKIESSKKA